MEYIKVTKENLEIEHICCAISNNKDIQVCSKKVGLQTDLRKDWFFSKVQKEENVLSNIFRLKTHGIQLLRMAICILTVCGWQVLLKDMVMLQIY